jgi:hypothetical protein
MPGNMTSPVSRLLPFVFTCLAPLAGCDGGLLGGGGDDFRAAVDEVVATGEGESLENDVIELTTSFTLAAGLETAAMQVRNFVQSQLPCAVIETPEPNTLVVVFGAAEGNCEYNGRSLDGKLTVAFDASAQQVVVTHTYEGLTNGRATLDGAATVTWSEASRHVVTDLDVETSRGNFTANSDRTQRRIGGAGEGIVVVGSRDWSGPRGDWHLEIEDVEMRGIDPVPQDGAYVLTQPNGNDVTMTFDRIDEDTIEVDVRGGRRDRVFHVSSAGNVDDA